MYPSTLERAFKLLLKKLHNNKKDVLELKEYSEKLQEVNDKFIQDLKMLLKDNDLNERTDNPTS